MQSSEKFKTPLTFRLRSATARQVIISPRKGEANSARHGNVCVRVHDRNSPLLLEKRRGQGEELTII
jgi:hypothetical protein